MRQSNVIRSPRMYNFQSSTTLQNTTVKGEGSHRNARHGKIQQVTVGPTESEPICEIFYRPQNSKSSLVIPNSSKTCHSPGLDDSSPWQLNSRSDAFRRPYFEKFSDDKLPSSTADVAMEEKMPRHLLSTRSIYGRNSREIIRPDANNTYVRRGRLHQPVHLEESELGHYISPVRRIAVSQRKPRNGNEHMRRMTESKFQKQTEAEMLTTSAYLSRYLHNQRKFYHDEPNQARPSTASDERIRPYRDSRQSKFENSQHHQVQSQYFDVFKSDGHDTTSKVPRTCDYFSDRFSLIPSSIDFDQTDIFLSEPTNHNPDSFFSEYDVTIQDADREHYLNQKVLQETSEYRALRDGCQEQCHLVQSNDDSSTETISDKFSDIPIEVKFNEEVCLSERDSSLHVSELDSDISDRDIISSPVKSSLKSKSRTPTLMDDFKIYHKMAPVKQVHFKEPISVATAISNVTLEELGLTSESSDHEINVVELEDDHPVKQTSLKLERKTPVTQNAGNTPKVRNKKSVNREIFSSNLENRPLLIRSFEESSSSHESGNVGCENCFYSTQDNSSGNCSDTPKVDKGTNTCLQTLPHTNYKTNETSERIRPAAAYASDTLFHERSFNGCYHFDDDSCSWIEGERCPDSSIAPQKIEDSFNENAKGHDRDDRKLFMYNRMHQHSRPALEGSPLTGNSQLKNTRLTPFSHGNAVGSTPDDTAGVQRIPGQFQSCPNPPVSSTRSRDYRMMRLQAVIDCSPPKDKQNIINKAR